MNDVETEVRASKSPQISMVIGTYNRPRLLVATLHCLLIQTVRDFEIIVAHDGPGPETRQVVMHIGDGRIRYCETDRRHNDWGNSGKELGSLMARGEFIGHSNDDNYYAPVYFEQMLGALESAHADFAYCNMVHSHINYTPLSTMPCVGNIDGGGWICRASIVKSTRWPEPKSDFVADGRYVEALVLRCRGVVKVNGFLFVHN